MRRITLALSSLALLLIGVPLTASATPFTEYIVYDGFYRADNTDSTDAPDPFLLLGVSRLWFDGSTFLRMNLTTQDSVSIISGDLAMKEQIPGMVFSIDGSTQTVVVGITDTNISGNCQLLIGNTLKCDFTLGDGTSGIDGLLATPVGVVPEPSSALLFAVGGLVVGRSLRRKP